MARQLSCSAVLILVVLMTVTNPAQTRCPDGWTYYPPTDTCMVYFDCKINQTDADFICSAMNGYLAVARDKTEGRFLWSLSQRLSKVWLGLRDVSDTSSPRFWQWVTDDGFSWANWRSRNDGSRGERCAVMNQNNAKWETRDCGNFAAFACSRPATTAQPSLVIDTTLPWMRIGTVGAQRPDDDTETDGNDATKDGGSGDL